MHRACRLLIVLLAAGAAATCGRREAASVSSESSPALRQTRKAPQSVDLAYVCPMDPDIRSAGPGKCTRCGMALVAGIPDQTEYHLDLSVAPAVVRPNEQATLTFDVLDPWKDRPVEKFSTVHEKLFHLFVVSRDLQFFLHAHPTWKDGSFQYEMAFPRPGMYRVLSDFYPEGAAPQLIADTVFVAGTEPKTVSLVRDYTPKHAENLTVSMTTNPPEPVAGVTALLRFNLDPGSGLQQYLGAWGHMLVASDDLIDAVHTHPTIADGRAEMQFNVAFPRPRLYRIWVQFQRDNVVNTVHFDVAVKAPESASTAN